MGRFKNQASIRTKASKIGGGTIILSIILIGIFSSQQNEDTLSNAVVQEPMQVETLAPNSLESLKSEGEELSIDESETVEILEKNKDIASTDQVDAVLKTSSMVQYGSMQTLVNGESGKIVWRTLAQRHIEFFEIERSIDDETYVLIGRIPGEGSGEHMEEKLYEFIDEKLAMIQMPRVYYRIKQIGHDGVIAYSEVMEHDFDLDLGLYARIEEKKDGKLKILYAADKTGPISMKLLNVAGQIVERRNLEANFNPQALALDVSNWKKGNYFLQLEDETSSVMEQFQYEH